MINAVGLLAVRAPAQSTAGTDFLRTLLFINHLVEPISPFVHHI
jgi:hypothetical protein